MLLRGLISSSLLGFLLVACSGHQRAANSPAPASSGILGGEIADADSPAAKVVVLIYNPFANSVCTGTLIAEDLVLTLNHCLPEDPTRAGIFLTTKAGQNPENFRKVIDSRRMTEPTGTDAEPSAPKSRAELAVLRFEGPLPAAKRIARLARPQEKARVGSRFLAIGYGTTNGRIQEEDFDDSGVLRKVILEVDGWYWERAAFTVDQTTGRGVCVGDSGSPALAWTKEGTPVVLGVASGVYYPHFVERDESFDECLGKSIYVEITSYLPWLRQAVSELGR